MEGVNKGKGEAGGAVNQVISLLSEYDHEIQITPMKRKYALLYEEEKHCSFGLFKNQKREKGLHISQPYQYYFPYGVTTHIKHEPLLAPFLDMDGRIDLGKAIKSGVLKLAVTDAQSFGENIDRILEQHHRSVEKLFFGLKTRYELVKKLFGDYRFNATLAIPEEVSYIASQEKLDPSAIRYYPIQGIPLFGSSHWGYAMCSKSDLGKEVTGKINDHIDAIRESAFEHYRRFLGTNERKIHQDAQQKLLRSWQ